MVFGENKAGNQVRGVSAFVSDLAYRRHGKVDKEGV